MQSRRSERADVNEPAPLSAARATEPTGRPNVPSGYRRQGRIVRRHVRHLPIPTLVCPKVAPLASRMPVALRSETDPSPVRSIGKNITVRVCSITE